MKLRKSPLVVGQNLEPKLMVRLGFRSKDATNGAPSFTRPTSFPHLHRFGFRLLVPFLDLQKLPKLHKEVTGQKSKPSVLVYQKRLVFRPCLFRFRPRFLDTRKTPHTHTGAGAKGKQTKAPRE